MQTITDDRIIKNGFIVAKVKLYNENDEPQTPKTAKWTLRNFSGDVINNREDVSIDAADLGTILYIPLSGDDLPVGWLKMSVQYTYDSLYKNDAESEILCSFYVNDGEGN